jgi:hypothetical protein
VKIKVVTVQTVRKVGDCSDQSEERGRVFFRLNSVRLKESAGIL